MGLILQNTYKDYIYYVKLICQALNVNDWNKFKLVSTVETSVPWSSFAVEKSKQDTTFKILLQVPHRAFYYCSTIKLNNYLHYI